LPVSVTGQAALWRSHNLPRCWQSLLGTKISLRGAVHGISSNAYFVNHTVVDRYI